MEYKNEISFFEAESLPRKPIIWEHSKLYANGAISR